MAEAAIGLAIGTVALASLFSTCVECMEYVSLAHNYGHDYEVCLTKILLLKARLNAWGESLHVENEGRELPVLRERWSQERETVGRSLLGIKDIFEDAGNLENKYGLQRVGVQDDRTTSILKAQSSAGLAQVEEAFRGTVVSRQKPTSIWKKTTWAIRDNKKSGLLR